jgi:hypothetical protein
MADAAAVQAGMSVEVADNDRQAVRGKVTRRSGLSQDGTFELEAVLDGRKLKSAVIGHDGSILAPASERERFFLGQDVVLQVVSERLPASPSVPKSALRQAGDGTQWLFVSERVAGQRVARRRQVTLGAENETQAQVLSGLSEGQIIIASAEPSLRDGDVVVPATAGEGVFRSLYVPTGQVSH